MLTHTRQAMCLLAIGLCGIVGCSSGNSVSTAPAPPPKPVLNPGVPQTPEAAVQAVLDGLKASKPIALWEAMTASQQKDFNTMFRQIATDTDPDIWKQTMENLNKLLTLAETKKDFILKSPLLKSTKQFKPEEVKAMWDPAIKFAKTLLHSDLADQEKLKNFDGQVFLAGTGATLLAQARELSHTLKSDPLKQIDGIKVTVKKESDHSATATIDLGGPTDTTMEIPLIIKEGKWTSEQLGLLQTLITFRLQPLTGRLRPYVAVEWKDQYLADMKRVGKMLDQLQATKTADDFQAAVTVQVLPFVLQKGLQFAQKQKPLTPLEIRSQGRPKATAMVIVKGDHFADEPGMLEMMKIFRATAAENKGMAAGPFGVQESMVMFVSPITDTEALAKQIHIGKVVKVDVKRNTIKVDLPPSPSTDKTTAEADGASKSTAH
jgi:hypothetical protein